MDEVNQDFDNLTRQSRVTPEGSPLGQMPPGKLQDRQLGREELGYPARVGRWKKDKD